MNLSAEGLVINRGESLFPRGTSQPNSLPGAARPELQTGCMLNTYRMLMCVISPSCICTGGRKGSTQERKCILCAPPNPPCWYSSGRLIRRLSERSAAAWESLSGLSLLSLMIIFTSNYRPGAWGGVMHSGPHPLRAGKMNVVPICTHNRGSAVWSLQALRILADSTTQIVAADVEHGRASVASWQEDVGRSHRAA